MTWNHFRNFPLCEGIHQWISSQRANNAKLYFCYPKQAVEQTFASDFWHNGPWVYPLVGLRRASCRYTDRHQKKIRSFYEDKWEFRWCMCPYLVWVSYHSFNPMLVRLGLALIWEKPLNSVTLCRGFRRVGPLREVNILAFSFWNFRKKMILFILFDQVKKWLVVILHGLVEICVL